MLKRGAADMTLTADRLFCLNVAGPTSRVVSLASRGVDREDVRSRLIGGRLRSLVTSIARRFLEMRPVPEVVKTKRRPERRAVLHRIRLVYVTGPAGSELVVWLVNVTRVAFGVLRHAGLQALCVKSMAEITSGCALRHLVGVHLPLHLLGARMIAMNKALESKLHKLRRKRDQRPLRVKGNLVADNAQFALQIRHIFVVAVPASRVSREQRGGIVARPRMAG